MGTASLLFFAHIFDHPCCFIFIFPFLCGVGAGAKIVEFIFAAETSACVSRIGVLDNFCCFFVRISVV